MARSDQGRGRLALATRVCSGSADDLSGVGVNWTTMWPRGSSGSRPPGRGAVASIAGPRRTSACQRGVPRTANGGRDACAPPS
jgi:hypothetical protein